jgi:hypothetical protein
MRKLKGIANERDEAVMKLLTKEQQKEYVKIVAEQRQKMKERFQDNKPG